MIMINIFIFADAVQNIIAEFAPTTSVRTNSSGQAANLNGRLLMNCFNCFLEAVAKARLVKAVSVQPCGLAFKIVINNNIEVISIFR